MVALLGSTARGGARFDSHDFARDGRALLARWLGVLPNSFADGLVHFAIRALYGHVQKKIRTLSRNRKGMRHPISPPTKGAPPAQISARPTSLNTLFRLWDV